MWWVVTSSPGDDEIAARAACPGLGETLFRTSQAECTAGYGYGHLSVANETHLHWEFFQTGKAPNAKQREPGDAIKFKEKQLRDYLWLVQDKHGPRDYCSSSTTQAKV